MALADIKELLDTKIAHTGAFGIFAASWTEYLNYAIQIVSIVYIVYMALNARENYLKRRVERLKTKDKP